MLDTLFIGLDTVMTQIAIQSCKLADIIAEPGAAEARWHDVIRAQKDMLAGERSMRAAVPRLHELLSG